MGRTNSDSPSTIVTHNVSSSVRPDVRLSVASEPPTKNVIGLRHGAGLKRSGACGSARKRLDENWGILNWFQKGLFSTTTRPESTTFIALILLTDELTFTQTSPSRSGDIDQLKSKDQYHYMGNLAVTPYTNTRFVSLPLIVVESATLADSICPTYCEHVNGIVPVGVPLQVRSPP